MRGLFVKVEKRGPEFDKGLSFLNLAIRLVKKGNKAKKKSYSLRRATALVVAQLRELKSFDVLDDLGYPRD